MEIPLLENLPTVVMVGRANVGKSTLFNRIIDMKKALVSDMAGTTRDINQGIGYWQGVNFRLIDTGGIERIFSVKKTKKMAPIANEEFASDIAVRSRAALDKADLILFVVDGQVGIQPADRELAKKLREAKVPVYLVVNKLDAPMSQPEAEIFQRLGFENPEAVSALTGRGVGDLLDEVTAYLIQTKNIKKDVYLEIKPDIKVALIGKPNVGKSSLFNKLIGEERVIVSPIPHTTREPNDITIEHGDSVITFIDTAGIRRQARREKGLEQASIAKSVHSAERADIVLFVIDIDEGITTQDKHLAELVGGTDAGIIIIANKWDLIEDKTTNLHQEMQQDIYYHFPSMSWAPVHFVSAKTGKHVQTIFELIEAVEKNRRSTIDEPELQQFIKKATIKHKPVAGKGIRRPRILGFEQVGIQPPRFVMRIKPTDNVATSYLRYLENQLRDHFNLFGTKLWISVKK